MTFNRLPPVGGALLGVLLMLPLPLWAAPDIQHWQTANGARVYFVAAAGLPMVDVRVVFDAGSARDAGKAGLAKLTNALLAEGTASMDADRVADRFESLGAQFGTDSLRDMAVVSLRSLTDPELLTPALATFTQVLTVPAFPAAGLERERQRTLVALQQEEQSPEDIAEKAFYRAIYGEHPYAAPALGTTASVKALTRADLVDFHRRYYVGRNAVLAIVGAVSLEQAHALAEQVVGRLAEGVAAPALPPVPDLHAALVSARAYPSEQTTALLGQPGIARDDPDYFPLVVGNHILGGGGFSSRLVQQVRDQRGLAYSVYSYFLPMHQRGPFTLGVQTRNDQAQATIALMRQVLEGFIADGPSAAELSAAQRNLTGGFPLRLDSNSKLVENLAMLGFYGLPLDYLDTYIGKVEAVTAEQIRDAFRRRVHPDRLVTISVGRGPDIGG